MYPFTLLTMYAAAASGWLIFFVMPPLVTAWLAVSHEVKLQSVKSRQNGLVEEWGREVRKAAGVDEEQEEAEPAQPLPTPETSAAEPAPSLARRCPRAADRIARPEERCVG